VSGSQRQSRARALLRRCAEKTRRASRSSPCPGRAAARPARRCYHRPAGSSP